MISTLHNIQHVSPVLPFSRFINADFSDDDKEEVLLMVLVVTLPISFASQSLSYSQRGNLITGDGFYREYDAWNHLVKIHSGDNATALLRFRKYFTSDFEKDRPPALLDMGCNDGRVVVLAYILGYRAEGIEIDDVAYREASGYIQMLDRRIPGLARDVSIVQGDYSTSNGVRNLRTRLKFVDIFFNYDDTNVDKIAEVILRRGKQGDKLLLHSYSERKDQVPLKLSHMIKLGNEGKAYRVDYPVFDVFVRER